MPEEQPSFRLSDYDFSFPKELIAERTAGKGKTRLLCVSKQSGDYSIEPSTHLVQALQPGDCLVVNNTQVIPARLLGHKPSGGAVEVLLVQHLPGQECARWEAWVRPGRAFRTGKTVVLGAELEWVHAEVESVNPDGIRVLKFNRNPEDFYRFLEQYGHVPLPPYIERPDDQEDVENYQTIFAKHKGAVAAPTASLHFNQQMVEDLKAKGVRIAEVTLHVGPGTFQNISSEDFRQHQMHAEVYHMSEDAAQLINMTKMCGGRVVAVGTTSTRVLETVADEQGKVHAGQGETRAFLYPGVRWKVVDGLLTNFHWPKSSLILLVASLLGRERTLDAYQYAVRHRMKLFSYGDGMLIL